MLLHGAAGPTQPPVSTMHAGLLFPSTNKEGHPSCRTAYPAMSTLPVCKLVQLVRHHRHQAVRVINSMQSLNSAARWDSQNSV